MELLDVVPADAMALRLYSLPVAASTVGSLCAWLVAALAAVVGLWRIRAVGSSNKHGAGVRTAHVDGNQKLPLPSPAVDEPRPARAETAEPASEGEPSGPSKIRFTAYYGGSGDDDGASYGVKRCADVDDDRVCVDGEEETVLRRTASMRRSRSTALTTAVPSWEEREMAVRRADLGWYLHLDMAALDGSVVRLWDGEAAGAAASPRDRRRARLELHLS